MRTIRIVYPAAFWLIASFAAAQVGPPTEADKKLTEADIKLLVEQLVSPNEEPQCYPKVQIPEAIYPPGYDREAQMKVHRSFNRLLRVGRPAFPHVVERLDDPRYCFTADSGAADRNWTVGDACLDIIRCNIQPYGNEWVKHDGDPRGLPRRASYSERHNLHDPKAAKLWWEQRKTKSLVELQIETLQFVIADEAKTPKKYSEQERKYLQDLLERLQSTKTPREPWLPFSI